MSGHGEGGEVDPADGSERADDLRDRADADGDGAGAGAGPAGARAGTPAEATSRQKRQVILLLAGILLVAVLALAALFYLGTRLSLIGASPASTAAVSAVSTPKSTPTPVPTPALTARPSPGTPVPPGTYAWDELGGGECLGRYAGPWAEEFSVVDCAVPHPAQLLARTGYPAGDTGYPGTEAIAAQLNLLCSSPTVIGSAAAAYPDLQIEGAYPATAEQWDVGQRDYFCFVSRASGEPLTGSVAAGP